MLQPLPNFFFGIPWSLRGADYSPCRVVRVDLVGGISTVVVVEPRWDFILARAVSLVRRKVDMDSNFSLLESIRLDILPSQFLLDLDNILLFPVWRRLPLPLSRWGWGSNFLPLDFFQAANYFFFSGEIRSYSGFGWYRRSTPVLVLFPLFIAPVRTSAVATSAWVTRLLLLLYLFKTGHVGNRK